MVMFQWSFLSEIKDIFVYRGLLKNLVLRDIKVRYKRSILGFLWVMLNPLLIMLILYTVFSKIFGSLIPNYSSYIITGIVLWNMFSQSTTTSTFAFIGNSSILKKIYIPKAILPVSYIVSGLINFCFATVPLIIIILISGTAISVRAIMLPLCIGEILLFCIGLSLFLSTVVVFFHDIIYIYDVLLMAWMYSSPIFYPTSVLPPSILKLMIFNPMYHYLGAYRGLLYDTSIAMSDIQMFLVYGLGFAMISFIAGAIVYTSNKNNVIFFL
ncbi:ABC-type polysaccharide/polyol phosphate export system, permease component [Candidatus Magnetoovum chiemensis]|nr:ABC-type polysaccharide/polyol phosphate export system, permease component [Candidatus Magnetoovum chiemensis]